MVERLRVVTPEKIGDEEVFAAAERDSIEGKFWCWLKVHEFIMGVKGEGEAKM